MLDEHQSRARAHRGARVRVDRLATQLANAEQDHAEAEAERNASKQRLLDLTGGL